MSQLLLDERPVVLQPSLIAALGFEMATVLQQVHWYLQNPKSGREIDGEKWIYNTYAEWRENDFPFWSERTIQRWFLALEKKKLLVTCQPDKADWNRKKYYRINYEALRGLVKKVAPSIVPHVAPSMVQDVALSNAKHVAPSYNETKNSSKNSSKRGESSYLNSTQPPAAPTRNQAPPFEDFSDNSNELEPLKREIGKACGIRKSGDFRTEDELSRQAITLKAQRITPEAIRETVKANPSKVFKLKFFAEDILSLHAVTRRAAEPEPEDLRICKADNCVGGTVREWLESGKYRDKTCPECKGKGKVPVQIRARQEEAARRRAAANVDQLLSF